MAELPQNPFENEKPKIVHLEKNESHYEECRTQMLEIERIHRRTFFCNLGICILVCLLSVFRVYIGGFSILSIPFSQFADRASMMLAGGMFQILIALVVILLGYLA